jgi:hypothetical protein
VGINKTTYDQLKFKCKMIVNHHVFELEIVDES